MFFQPVNLNDDAYEFRTTQTCIFPKHWHADIEILYCMRGSFSVSVGNEQYVLKTNDIIFIGSGEVHDLCDPIDETKAAVVRLGSLFCGKNVFNEMLKRRVETPIIENDPDVNAEMQNIIALHTNKKTYIDELEIQGRLYVLLTLLLRKIKMTKHISEDHQARLKMMMKIQKALDIVAAQYNEKISLDDVAYASGYERGSFCRIFKNATGCTFHKYLNDYRIKKAMIMLEDNHYSMAEIAEQIGFSQQKKFSKIFKESVGVTPTQYRKMYLTGNVDTFTDSEKILMK